MASNQLSTTTKRLILARDPMCVVCQDPMASQVHQIRAGDSALNGCKLCIVCVDAIKRREVGISGHAPHDLKIVDGREPMKKKQADEGERKPRGKSARAPKGAAQGQEAAPVHAVTTFRPNGAESTTVAPEPSGVDLGPIVLPGPDGAVAVLRKLAEVNDRVIQAQKRYEDAKAVAKQRKEKWDELVEELSSMLREATHGSDKPILELAEREADQAAMQAGGEVATDPRIDALSPEELSRAMVGDDQPF
jgi:hypothetical protein